eukprot:COSAG01_NODE_9230_length_2512_cov_6.851637_4_plen_297_part_00
MSSLSPAPAPVVDLESDSVRQVQKSRLFELFSELPAPVIDECCAKCAGDLQATYQLLLERLSSQVLEAAAAASAEKERQRLQLAQEAAAAEQAALREELASLASEHRRVSALIEVSVADGERAAAGAVRRLATSCIHSAVFTVCLCVCCHATSRACWQRCSDGSRAWPGLRRSWLGLRSGCARRDCARSRRRRSWRRPRARRSSWRWSSSSARRECAGRPSRTWRRSRLVRRLGRSSCSCVPVFLCSALWPSTNVCSVPVTKFVLRGCCRGLPGWTGGPSRRTEGRGNGGGCGEGA